MYFRRQLVAFNEEGEVVSTWPVDSVELFKYTHTHIEENKNQTKTREWQRGKRQENGRYQAGVSLELVSRVCRSPRWFSSYTESSRAREPPYSSHFLRESIAKILTGIESRHLFSLPSKTWWRKPLLIPAEGQGCPIYEDVDTLSAISGNPCFLSPRNCDKRKIVAQ